MRLNKLLPEFSFDFVLVRHDLKSLRKSVSKLIFLLPLFLDMILRSLLISHLDALKTLLKLEHGPCCVPACVHYI